jgi:biopolymer transport protein ExbB
VRGICLRLLITGFVFASVFALLSSVSFGQVTEAEISLLQKDAESARATAGTDSSLASRKHASGLGVKQSGIDFLSLLVKGGIFMIPIGVVSLLVVTFVIDRWIGLRSGKLMPSEFRRNMMKMIRSGDVADPRDIYRLCDQNPSALASIASAAIVRAGRPQAEIAAAANDALQREVDRAYSHVRWLNLAAGVAPLLGLLGTVWGLIRAFHDTTQLTAGQNRADFLAVGIYEALVTTLAGLIVAIPAAIASHYFEGRITKAFGRIEEIISELVRSLERFEGKTRFDVIGRELAPRDIQRSAMPPPPPPIAPMASSGTDSTRVADPARSKSSRRSSSS